MNKFFVPKDIYEDRMNICKGCKYYFSPTGNCRKCTCFMKVKSWIAPLECPEKYWLKTTDIESIKDFSEIPIELIKEVVDLYPSLKTGRAKDQEAKKKMIELYNTIYGSNYSVTTSCGSCISACFDGITKLYKQNLNSISGNN